MWSWGQFLGRSKRLSLESDSSYRIAMCQICRIQGDPSLFDGNQMIYNEASPASCFLKRSHQHLVTMWTCIRSLETRSKAYDWTSRCRQTAETPHDAVHQTQLELHASVSESRIIGLLSLTFMPPAGWGIGCRTPCVTQITFSKRLSNIEAYCLLSIGLSASWSKGLTHRRTLRIDLLTKK